MADERPLYKYMHIQTHKGEALVRLYRNSSDANIDNGTKLAIQTNDGIYYCATCGENNINSHKDRILSVIDKNGNRRFLCTNTGKTVRSTYYSNTSLVYNNKEFIFGGTIYVYASRGTNGSSGNSNRAGGAGGAGFKVSAKYANNSTLELNAYGGGGGGGGAYLQGSHSGYGSGGSGGNASSTNKTINNCVIANSEVSSYSIQKENEIKSIQITTANSGQNGSNGQYNFTPGSSKGGDGGHAGNGAAGGSGQYISVQSSYPYTISGGGGGSGGSAGSYNGSRSVVIEYRL